MKTCTFEIEGVSTIGFSKAIASVKDTGESHDDFEARTWRERAHIDNSGEMFIPPMAIKLCLSDCARFLSESVPGKGKATYTKHFEAGVMCFTPMMLGVNINDCRGQRLHVPSDGKKGGGKRVWRTFPVLDSWKTSGELVLLDPILTGKPDKVREYLEHAGKFIGMGMFRPRNGGFWGRFKVNKFSVS